MFKLTLALFVIALSCVCADEEPQKFHYFGHEYDRTPLGDTVDKTSLKLLKEAYEEASDKNVVASPLGVLLLLSLYSSGAGEGVVRDEIVQALGAENYDNLFTSYTNLSQRFSAMNATYLTLANKVYVSKEYELSETFTDTAVKSYHSEVERIDFTDTKKAAAIINKWADEKTKGNIKDPVKDDDLTPDVVAGLFNIIFFQGHWGVPFNVSETVEKDFHVDNATTVKKQTMHLEQSLFYHDSPELGAKMIELPYTEQNFRMVVILPNEVDGLPSVLEKATQKGLLADIFALEPAGRSVNLELPKFEIKSGLDLNKILPKVGVSKIFTDPARNVLKSQPVKVSKAFQEAFVKVDEEGATAGAFTGAVLVPYSFPPHIPPPLEFKVDHPFLFAILHQDIVLFIGAYTH